METSSVLLVLVLVTCSVSTIHGRSVQVKIDDQDQTELETSVDASKKLPGLCWACKWSLKKVKKAIGSNATADNVSAKLKSVCNEIGLLASLCRKFVDKHLGELIEELTTTDDVRTICVNTRACKPKELLGVLYYQDNDDFQVEVNEYP